MKVLMISIDKGLLGRDQLGDVINRHAAYGKYVDILDILVLSPVGFNQNKISDNVTAYPTNSATRLKYYFDGLRIAKKMYQKKKYDLVVCQEPFVGGLIAVKLKKKFKIKILLHFHGDFWQNPSWLKESKLNFLFLAISKITVRKADGIRVMSEGQKTKLISAGINQEIIKVISTPVNLEKYRHPDINQVAINRGNGMPIVLHVSRDDVVKDFPTLIKVFDLVYQNFPPVRFWQVGARSTMEELKKKFPHLPITLTGKIDQNSLVNIYHAADVLVLTSTSESFGKVLVEANACGKPVVATQTTGAKEIVIDGENGYLAPVGDAEKIAEKIIYLLNNPAVAKAMGARGLELVNKNFGNNTEKIISFWREVAGI
ncbi:MAG: glycosyltransferase family 4 protein [Patescibacteria group bacterium]|nr:glycosyltransferase family 4 protein [Patescibacteria group bacterium]